MDLLRHTLATVKKNERGKRPTPVRLAEASLDALGRHRRRIFEGDGAGAAAAQSGAQKDSCEEWRPHESEYIAAATRAVPRAPLAVQSLAEATMPVRLVEYADYL